MVLGEGDQLSSLTMVFWHGAGRADHLRDSLFSWVVDSACWLRSHRGLSAERLHAASECSLGFPTAWIPKRDPGRSCMTFSNLLSEATRCHSHGILFKEQSQRLAQFQGRDTDSTSWWKVCQRAYRDILKSAPGGININITFKISIFSQPRDGSDGHQRTQNNNINEWVLISIWAE